jgi:hypothetical protein
MTLEKGVVGSPGTSNDDPACKPGNGSDRTCLKANEKAPVAKGIKKRPFGALRASLALSCQDEFLQRMVRMHWHIVCLVS